MDRNTIIGLLLIGAVLFGFNYFNRPSEAELAQTKTEQVDTTKVATPSVEAVSSATAGLPVEGDSTHVEPLYLQRRPAEVVELGNDKLTLRISSRGAMPLEARLSRYLNQNKQPVTLFGEGDARFDLPLRTKDNTLLHTADLSFVVQSKTDSSVVMRLPIDEESYLDYTYTLKHSDYRVNLSISGSKLEHLLPANMTLQDLEWRQRIPQQEQSHKFEVQYSGIYYHYTGGGVDNLAASKDDTEKVKEGLRWVAFKDKYFSSVLIGDDLAFDDSSVSSTPQGDSTGYVADYTLKTTFAFSPESSKAAHFTFFFGPNDYKLLRSYNAEVKDGEELQLDHLVYLGWSGFRLINKWLIIPIVTFLQEYISNWGIIILLLTIFIKLLLSPFTYKSLLSQAKMRVLRPQIEEINKKYPGKEQDVVLKKQQETMALYSSAGASPMSGCLPMLLQMPFLIALYMYFPTSILLRGQSFLWADDLSTYDPVIQWHFDIPVISSLLGNHISLFCLLMTIVNVIYNRYMMSQSATSGSEAVPGMKWMPYMMSLMFFFMFNQNASGLSYYYFISTLITIIQYFVFRYTINEDKLLAQMEENKKKPRKKSSFMKRLEEAQRLQQEQARQRKK